MSKIIKFFYPFIIRYKLQFMLSILGVMLFSAATTSLAYVVQPMIDDIFISKNKTMLYYLLPIIFIIYATKSLGRYLQVYFTVFIGQNIIKEVKSLMIAKVLKLNMKSFFDLGSGQIISRISSDTFRIQILVSESLPMILRESLTILFLAGVIFYQNYKLAFFALVLLPLAAYPINRLIKKIKSFARSSQENNANLTLRINEIIRNIAIIKIANTQALESNRFDNFNKAVTKSNLKITKNNELISPLMESIASLGMMTVILVGGLEVINGSMTAGMFFSFLTALLLINTPIKTILMQAGRIQDGVVASERILEILNLKDLEAQNDHKTKVTSISSIAFKDISLLYGDHAALKKISLNANQGQVIALVGPSGGGKSSIVNLLVGFFKPSSGQILINNKSLESYCIKSLRSKVALVSQEVFIFKDSIAANVAYGEEVDRQKVLKALKFAEANFIDKLPKGIDSNLEEAGKNLSGGEKQRIALARAFYKDAAILILDEASSALDNITEAKIMAKLNQIRSTKIIFIIAHRLSTIKDADHVLVLQQGEIIDQGSEQYLSEHSKIYQALKYNFYHI